MKYIPHVIGALLGAFFIFSAVTFLTGNIPKTDPPPSGSPAESFFNAFGPTGYFTFVKVLELVGGLLLAIPMTRNFGLLVLGPIILNIVAYHHYVGGDALKAPAVYILSGISVAALYLLWDARKKFLGLLN